LNDAEQETSGYNHAQIGMALAENWNLPKILPLASDTTTIPWNPRMEITPLFSACILRNYCCQKSDIGFCDAPLQDEALFTQCCQKLHIEPHGIDLIMGEVQQKITDMESEGLL
jgi:hypothetical protein